VDALTEDWATANGFTYDNIIASPTVAQSKLEVSK